MHATGISKSVAESHKQLDKAVCEIRFINIIFLKSLFEKVVPDEKMSIIQLQITMAEYLVFRLFYKRSFIDIFVFKILVSPIYNFIKFVHREVLHIEYI